MESTVAMPKAPTWTLLQEVRNRFRALKSEYQGGGWFKHHQALSENIMPRTGRFFATDSNDTRENLDIYDNSATRAARVLAAGLMSGMSSPHQPWVRLRTPDVGRNNQHDVRMWLDDVTERMMRVLSRSNFYRTMHQMYEELAVYGTAACILVPDHERVFHCHALTAGQFFLSTDYRGKVTTLYREFRMTVGQLVREFGYERCSLRVQALYVSPSLDQWIEVVHAIEPRYDRQMYREDDLNMPWRSVYFEKGDGKDDIRDVLRESGYRQFPALAPRWNLTPGDIYGNGPGMEALPDIKQLQDEQFRKGQAVGYAVKPPLQLPHGMKNRETDFDPGGENYVDDTGPNTGIRTVWEPRLDMAPLLEDIHDVRSRIQASFFADLFLMIYQTSHERRTATEVAELHAEKLLMLGPVLERLDTELLAPAVELVYGYMEDEEMIPPAPEELEGMPLLPEFVSVLAQAQRAAGINSIDRFMTSIAASAEFWPEGLDKIDIDGWADEMARRYNVPPEIMRASDEVDRLRQARNEAQAQQAALDAETQAAGAAKDVAAAEASSPAAARALVPEGEVDPVEMAGGFRGV